MALKINKCLKDDKDDKDDEDVEEAKNSVDPEKEDKRVVYFGYGSNLSMHHFTRHKQLDIIRQDIGYIKDYALSFSLCTPDGSTSYANVHVEKDATVHGIVLWLTQSDFDALAKKEVAYRADPVKVYPYDKEAQPIDALTFVWDEQAKQDFLRKLENAFLNTLELDLRLFYR